MRPFLLAGADAVGTGPGLGTPDPARQGSFAPSCARIRRRRTPMSTAAWPREEAKGRMPGVYRNFDAIDTAHTGAVTMEQIEAYAAGAAAALAATEEANHALLVKLRRRARP